MSTPRPRQLRATAAPTIAQARHAWAGYRQAPFMRASFALATLALATLAGCTVPRPGDASRADDIGLRLADATLSAGATDTALHVLDGMLRRDPRDAAALTRRGRVLLALGRADEAAESFARANEVAPGRLDALVGLARSRAASGRAEAAEPAWRAALSRKPGDPLLQTSLAISLDLQARHAEAQSLYRAALASLPDDPAVRSDLGLSLALSGQTAEALPLLRQATLGGSTGASELNPAGGPIGGNASTAARARHNLAVGLAMAGDDAGARVVLRADLGEAEIGAALAGLRPLVAAR